MTCAAVRIMYKSIIPLYTCDLFELLGGFLCNTIVFVYSVKASAEINTVNLHMPLAAL